MKALAPFAALAFLILATPWDVGCRGPAALARLRTLGLLLVASCSTWATTGSVYRSSGPCPTHVGIRPAVDGPQGAVTVRVSGDPGCVALPTPAEQRVLDEMAASACRSQDLLEQGIEIEQLRRNREAAEQDRERNR